MKSELRKWVEAYEKELLIEALRRHEGHGLRCCAELGVASPQFYNLLRKYGIKIGNYRKPRSKKWKSS